MEAVGCKVDDTEFKDILLMNLDPPFHGVHTTILAQQTEPDLAEVRKMLVGATGASKVPSVFIKQEEDSTPFAFKATTNPHFCQSGQFITSPTPIDVKGFHWCDPTSSDCHQCGHTFLFTHWTHLAGIYFTR